MGYDAVSNIAGLKIKVLPVGKGMVHPQKFTWNPKVKVWNIILPFQMGDFQVPAVIFFQGAWLGECSDAGRVVRENAWFIPL